MIPLVLGLALFVGVHLLPSAVGPRDALVARLGEGGYKGVISLGSAAGLILVGVGHAGAPYVPLWTPPAWGASAAAGLMLAATLLLAAAFLPSSVKRAVRHPMLWAVALWGLAHLLANGDLASLLLFGGFGLWAAAGPALINRRKHPPFGPAVPWSRDAATALVGVGLYATLYFAHPYVFGVSPG